MRYFIPKSGIKAIDNAIEALFNRMKVRFLGMNMEPKQIRFTVRPDKPLEYREDLSLPSIFDKAAVGEGMRPNEGLKRSVTGIVEQYLDAHKEVAKAKVKSAVQAFLSESEVGDEGGSVDGVLKKELHGVMKKVTSGVKEVVDNEMGRAKNLSSLDAIIKLNAAVGTADPTVVFIGPNDSHTCDDCKRLYYLEDGITPRAWKMSELSHGYGKHGGKSPCTGNQHPRCRHSLAPMMRGYGFKGGRIEYIEPGFDVYAEQHKG